MLNLSAVRCFYSRLHGFGRWDVGAFCIKEEPLNYYIMHCTPVIPVSRFLRALHNLFVFLVLIFVVSCSDTNKNDVSVVPVLDIESALGNARIVDLSEIALDIQYIPLETTKNSVLRSLTSVVYERDKFYVGLRDFKVFSKDGAYLWSFDKSGRGPGEYMFSNSMKVDGNSGNIVVDVFSRDNITLYIYDSTGVFSHESVIEYPDSIKLGTTTVLDNGFFLSAAPQSSGQRVNYWAMVTDGHGRVVSQMSPAYSFDERGRDGGDIIVVTKEGERINLPSIVSNPYPFIFEGAGLVRLYSPYADTIYTMNANHEFVPCFAINHGSIPPLKEKPEVLQGYGKGKFISLLPKEYKEWKNHLLMAWLLNDYAYESYTDTLYDGTGKAHVRKHTNTYGIYDKTGGEFIFMKQPLKGWYGFNDDLAGGPPFIPSYISGDGKYAVSLVNTSMIEKFLDTNPGDSKFTEIAARVAFDDNPVAVLVTLK